MGPGATPRAGIACSTTSRPGGPIVSGQKRWSNAAWSNTVTVAKSDGQTLSGQTRWSNAVWSNPVFKRDLVKRGGCGQTNKQTNKHCGQTCSWHGGRTRMMQQSCREIVVTATCQGIMSQPCSKPGYGYPDSYWVPMCLTRLNGPLQTSHKDGKAHFENNISHKDRIQLLLTCLDNLFDELSTISQSMSPLDVEEAEEFLCSHHWPSC